MTYRGVTSASLIYDKHPIMDYFRKVTDDIVVGLGDQKGKPTDFFFHLTREWTVWSPAPVRGGSAASRRRPAAPPR